MTDTFCALPWIHLSTRPNGHSRVCCTANASSVSASNDKEHGGEIGVMKNDDGSPANFNTTSLAAMWNANYMRNIRLKMLNGEEPESCKKCYVEERAGHKSKREWETIYWTQRGYGLDRAEEITEDDGTIPVHLPYIDLRFGSKCNLKCIMCSPHDSSMWVPDWQKMHPKVQNVSLKELTGWVNKGQQNGATYNWHMNNPTFWKELYEQIPNMYQLYFAGGEPLIIDTHYELLEEVIACGYASNIELRYNSNGLEWREDLFELWSHFKRVRFHYSIDSINEMNDYIRFPSKWEHQAKRFEILDKETSDKVEVTTACAVQALNIYYIPDFIMWKLDQGFDKINRWPFGAGLINYHFVYHPAYLNVKILPQWFKDECQKKYEAFYPWLEDQWERAGAPDKETFVNADYGIKRLKGMISFMQSEDWSNRLPEFVEYINIMDSIRETDFRTVFPEMSPILDEKA